MKEFFLTYPIAAWSVVSVMAAGLVIMLMWEKMKWWWHNTWYSFPLIGKIASLSSDVNRAQEPGWFKGERALCRDYKKFVRIQDEYDFNEKNTYLTRAGDLGRKETPAWIWILTVAMVFVEAMGFAYVLAGFTVPGASENTQQYGALGIAFLISVILVAFTHLAGHELFKSSQIANARRDWVDAGKIHDLGTGVVALAKPQNIDDNQPAYSQLANRVGIHPSYKITAATVMFVAIVAIFATYVRGTVLEQQLLLEKTGKSADVSLALPDSGDGLNLSVKTNVAQLPAADVAEQNKAEQKAEAEGTDNQRHGGWGTFVVLAFVFVFLQILGVIFGFRWGFAGRESSAAHRSIGHGRYSSYADVREHYQEIADTAQAKLESLQQKMKDINSKKGGKDINPHKSFRDFMEEERANQTKERLNEREHTDRRSATESAPVPSAKPATAVQPIEIAQESQALTLDAVLAQVDELSDVQAKRDYMSTLPADLRSQAAAAIKERKAAVEKAKADAELDGLFD